jgi:hypothetical protein
MRIGKECIGKLLSGDELQTAKGNLEDMEIEEQELRKIRHRDSRIFASMHQEFSI